MTKLQWVTREYKVRRINALEYELMCTFTEASIDFLGNFGEKKEHIILKCYALTRMSQWSLLYLWFDSTSEFPFLR